MVKRQLADAIVQASQPRVFRPPPFPRLRFFWTGPTKVGKTTLVAGMPNSLLIDLEGGAHSLVNPRAAVVWCPVYSDAEMKPEHEKIAAERDVVLVSLEGVMKQLGELANKPDTPVQHVIFDSIDWLQDMAIKRLNKEYADRFRDNVTDIREYKASAKGSGGYQIVFERVLSFHRQLTLWGYGWSQIGHITEKEKQVGKETMTVIRAACFPGIYGPLCQECDYQLNVDMEPDFVPGAKSKSLKQVVYSHTINKDDALELGGRVPLPARIDGLPRINGIDRIVEEYRKSAEKVSAAS